MASNWQPRTGVMEHPRATIASIIVKDDSTPFNPIWVRPNTKGTASAEWNLQNSFAGKLVSNSPVDSEWSFNDTSATDWGFVYNGPPGNWNVKLTANCYQVSTEDAHMEIFIAINGVGKTQASTDAISTTVANLASAIVDESGSTVSCSYQGKVATGDEFTIESSTDDATTTWQGYYILMEAIPY